MASTIAAAQGEPAPGASRATFRQRVEHGARDMLAWARTEPWQVLGLLLVGVGIWLRTRSFFGPTISLWADEAHWLIQLLKTPVMQPSIRPVGFMAASRFFAEHFGPSEISIRFLPWLFGVLGALLAIPLAWRLFKAPAARLLFVAVIALHPMAIDFSKEFKPYSISLFSHMCCLWCAASYWELGKRRWLAGTVGVSLIGVLFSQDVVFAYPALYLALGLGALQRKSYRDLALTVGGVLLALSLLGALYWFFWRFVGGAGGSGNKQVNGLASAWWSVSYDLFYTGKTDETHLAWITRKLSEVAAFPGWRRQSWRPGVFQGSTVEALAHVDHTVWVLLEVAGLVCIVWQKRWRDALLLLLTPLVVFFFNLIGLWPFGSFRSDLFLVAYTTAIACLAFDVRVKTERPLRALVPAALLVVAPLLVFERVWHEHKDAGGELLPGVSAALRLQSRNYTGRRELLVLDGFFCEVWRYYEEFHPKYRAEFVRIRRRFNMKCTSSWRQPALQRAQQLTRDSNERFWLVYAATTNPDPFDVGAPEGYEVVAHEHVRFGDTIVVALRRR